MRKWREKIHPSIHPSAWEKNEETERGAFNTSLIGICRRRRRRTVPGNRYIKGDSTVHTPRPSTFELPHEVKVEGGFGVGSCKVSPCPALDRFSGEASERARRRRERKEPTKQSNAGGFCGPHKTCSFSLFLHRVRNAVRSLAGSHDQRPFNHRGRPASARYPPPPDSS